MTELARVRRLIGVAVLIVATFVAFGLAGKPLIRLGACEDRVANTSCNHPEHRLVVEDHVALCRCVQ